MDMVIEREISSLKAFFPTHREFEVKELGPDKVSFSVKMSAEFCETILVHLTVDLDKNYPMKLPEIHLESFYLSHQEIENVKRAVLKECSLYIGYPFIFELLSILQTELLKVVKNQIVNKDPDPYSSRELTIGFMIENMRNIKNYRVTLIEWITKLHLSANFAYYRQYIVLILQGKDADIKIFQENLNTWCDGAMRECNQKMVTALGQTKCPQVRRGIEIVEVATLPILENYYKEQKLEAFFSLYVAAYLK